MTGKPLDLKRLGHAVRRRREALGLRQDEVGPLGGPSTTTLTKVENALPPPPTPLTLRRLDRGLKWEAGSAQRVLLGGDPVPIREVPVESPSHSTDPLARDAEAIWPVGKELIRYATRHSDNAGVALVTDALIQTTMNMVDAIFTTVEADISLRGRFAYPYSEAVAAARRFMVIHDRHAEPADRLARRMGRMLDAGLPSTLPMTIDEFHTYSDIAAAYRIGPDDEDVLEPDDDFASFSESDAELLTPTPQPQEEKRHAPTPDSPTKSDAPTEADQAQEALKPRRSGASGIAIVRGKPIDIDKVFRGIRSIYSDMETGAELVYKVYEAEGIKEGRAHINRIYFSRDPKIDVINELYNQINPEVFGKTTIRLTPNEWREWIEKLSTAMSQFDQANMNIQDKIVEIVPESQIDQLEGAKKYIEYGMWHDSVSADALEWMMGFWSKHAESAQLIDVIKKADRLWESRPEMLSRQGANLHAVERKLHEKRAALERADSSTTAAVDPPTAPGVQQRDGRSRVQTKNKGMPRITELEIDQEAGPLS